MKKIAYFGIFVYFNVMLVQHLALLLNKQHCLIPLGESEYAFCHAETVKCVKKCKKAANVFKCTLFSVCYFLLLTTLTKVFLIYVTGPQREPTVILIPDVFHHLFSRWVFGLWFRLRRGGSSPADTLRLIIQRKPLWDHTDCFLHLLVTGGLLHKVSKSQTCLKRRNQILFSDPLWIGFIIQEWKYVSHINDVKAFRKQV